MPEGFPPWSRIPLHNLRLIAPELKSIWAAQESLLAAGSSLSGSMVLVSSKSVLKPGSSKKTTRSSSGGVALFGSHKDLSHLIDDGLTCRAFLTASSAALRDSAITVSSGFSAFFSQPTL